MQTARRGLITAYGLLVLCVVWNWFSPCLYPVEHDLLDLSSFFITWGVIAPCATVAFAIFCGGVVCAGRALYGEAASRTASGYVTLVLSLLSACALFGLGVRGGFIRL